MMGTLHVVSTPIGNLDDITLRAIDVLRTVELIAAEDTRHSRRLLDRIASSARTISFHEHNVSVRLPALIEHLADSDLALITDAGTPAISDPGVRLVDAAHTAGIAVRVVPGASSVTAAVAVSGLVDGPFAFLGYAPRSAGERAALFGSQAESGIALVVFERGTRLPATLAALAAVMPERRAAICRELTKLHEEVVRGPLSELAARPIDAEPRGEIVIVVESGATARSDPELILVSLLTAGASPSVAAKLAAKESGVPRSDLYRRALEIKAGQPG